MAEDIEIRLDSQATAEDVQEEEALNNEELPEEKLEAENIPVTTADDILRGRIVTGMQLSVAAQKRIAARLQEVLGKRVKLSCRLDKKQLAGIRVELNGYSYDGTLRGQLQNLHKMLTRPDEEER